MRIRGVLLTEYVARSAMRVEHVGMSTTCGVGHRHYASGLPPPYGGMAEKRMSPFPGMLPEFLTEL